MAVSPISYNKSFGRVSPLLYNITFSPAYLHHKGTLLYTSIYGLKWVNKAEMNYFIIYSYIIGGEWFILLYTSI